MDRAYACLAFWLLLLLGPTAVSLADNEVTSAACPSADTQVNTSSPAAATTPSMPEMSTVPTPVKEGPAEIPAGVENRQHDTSISDISTRTASTETGVTPEKSDESPNVIWNLLGFFESLKPVKTTPDTANASSFPNLHPSLLAGNPQDAAENFLAFLQTKSGRGTLKTNASGGLCMQDSFTGKENAVTTSGGQIFAKPTRIKKQLGSDGKRTVIVETDHGDTVVEWPPADDPVFVDNPFRKPKDFVPNPEPSGGPAEGHKTVVAWWDRAWKRFQEVQRYLDDLLKKREKLLQGRKTAEETGNAKQTTDFDWEIFEVDQRITGTTGVLNQLEEFLKKFGELKNKNQ